jgi:hypothetical protein
MHALFATATASYPGERALSRQYRTLAVDILGEAGPYPRNLDTGWDYAAGGSVRSHQT